jgi:ceramide kinase
MNKNPFRLPFVEIHRAKEFRYNSADGNNVKKSVWNSDGEILENTEIHVKVHCQILPVFARGIEK